MRALCCLLQLLVFAYATTDAQTSNANLFPIVKDGAWGYIDREGTIVIKPQFTKGGDFLNGYAVVESVDPETKRPGLTFITPKGELLTVPKFSECLPFTDGLARVKMEEWNYLDTIGNKLLMEDFYECSPFTGGYALVEKMGGKRVIDRFGRTVKDSAALAGITLQERRRTFSEGLLPAESEREFGYVDSLYGWVIKPAFQECGEFSEGLAPVAAFNVDWKANWGFINSTGDMVIPPRFQEAQHFSCGGANVKVKGAWGRIDRQGRYVIQPMYDFIDTVSEGVVVVRGGTPDDPLFGYVKSNGDVIARPRFDNARSFSDGYAAVSVPDPAPKGRGRKHHAAGGPKFGYIDKSGALKIACKFDAAGDFHEGAAIVAAYDKKRRKALYGFIRKDGTYLVLPQFDDCSSFANGIAAVCDNGLWGYVNKNGVVICRPQFTAVEAFRNGLGRVYAGHAFGYVDEAGRVIWKPSL